jgi:4-hydroxy-tetrahydrodipicolinate synthase
MPLKKENIFKGLGVALVTPFHEDGTIDYDALSELLHYQEQNGVDFFCVLGSTAETPCLSFQEKTDVKNFVYDTLKGSKPILLGFGSNNTKGLVDEIHEFDFCGVDGILSVVPFYNKPSQEGMYRHFMEVSHAAGEMPVVLYNVPGRTGVNMLPETTLRIANDAENVVAIKEASGNVEQIAEIISKAPEGFGVLSGDDGLTYKLLGLGAAGVISVVGNAVTKEFASMVHAKLSGNDAEAAKINDSLEELYKLAFVDGNPAGIKALLSLKGLCNNVLRLPLVPARKETTEKLKAFA